MTEILHLPVRDGDRNFVEFVDEVCGIYFRSILLHKGEKAQQHVHDHDHATYIGSGSVLMFENGKDKGVFLAGTAIPVLAGVRHEFEALENGTRLACVHTAASAESVKAKGV